MEPRFLKDVMLQRNRSFAHLISRKMANIYVAEHEDLKDVKLYFLDEVYGKLLLYIYSPI